MISVGIDVSKEKSTVCVLKPYGEIVMKPIDVLHTESELSKLVSELQKLQEEVRIVMEATGAYHLPILSYLKEKGFFVPVVFKNNRKFHKTILIIKLKEHLYLYRM